MPVGKLLGQQAPQPSKWRVKWRELLQWRDWSLPVKLAAVTLVPMLIALVLGGTTIANQVERADGYERMEALVALNGELRTVLGEVQDERTQTVRLLNQGLAGDSAELETTRAELDRAIPAMSETADRAVELDGTLGGAQGEASTQLDRLPGIRDQVGAGQLDSAQAIEEYSAITRALLALDTTLVSRLSDAEIGGTPTALHALLAAAEQVSFEQALGGYGIARGGLTPDELNQVRTAEVRLADRLTGFRGAASGSQRQLYDGTVSGAEFAARTDLADRIVGGDASGQIDPQRWQGASTAVTDQLGTVADRLGTGLGETTSALVEGSSNDAGLLAVLLFSAFVLAAAVVFVITRQLLRSLRVLRASALDVADTQLPAAVHNIQEGRPQSTELQPVPVRTADEVGQVARAFDAVHSQALRLAVAQAAMRTGYSNVFVNLSRRSQSLVQRQLQLIERLERDEEDADQLATLFQLDHLATRMRRNNENLMVLSGSEPGRRSGQPISTTDVLRAAVSEIEQYQRVAVRTPPASRVLGYAASDLMRLLAELLDNATAFSAPDTQVIVATQLMDDGSLSLDIMDKGIGMNETEVAEANARLTESASVDLATSRRMGLFVVGRLASRHGFGVTLHGGKDIAGVRATVTVPAGLVVAEDTAPQAPEQPAASAPQQVVGGSLPRRQRQVNGTPVERPSVAAPHGAAVNGFGEGQQAPPPRTAGPPSEMEVSGTALFSPIERDGTEAERSKQTKPSQPSQQSQQPPRPRPTDQPAPRQEPTAEEAAWPTEQDGPDEVPPSEAATTAVSAESTETAGGTEPADDTESTERVQHPAASQAARRRPRGAVPGGKELFEANSTVLSDWWSAATTAADAARRAQQADDWRTETTPIFDATLSAWFRTAEEQPKAKDERDDAASAAMQSWDFASDESWRTVQAVSRTEPSSYTSAGLPRRRRGEYLMPGSAARTEGAGEGSSGKAAELPARDPADVRGRLSSFQQGLSRGRRRSTGEQPDRPERAQQAQRPQQPEQVQQPEQRAGGEGDADGDWSFASDERQRAARSATNSSPSAYTSAGLPRRRRGERLLPGSAGPAKAAPRVERDPADVRGRLSSFQQGIRRGRHQTAEPAEGNQEKVEGE
ncbi:sensor histidine kinase [Amycolatopsis cihanbeyliensis]|uniref:histidine kinase n=1 Tax=Amycolatopsis cihanbeyliensis TaxID=1128664 RepID=A0A542DDP8_AMYCI|nr:nitrate- and nitrite sensing domain-containing protein [Amycolatopsis cihanbeyliensis]TQJ01183.1 signal transduction histidine kinase [Amycolatopsis cihanbeyliensis]